MLNKAEISTIIRNSIHNYVVYEENELDDEIFFTRLKSFIQMLEGYETKSYLDGIKDPNNPARFIYAKDFYALNEEERDKLRLTCIDKNGKETRPITTVGIGANIQSDEIKPYYDEILGEKGLTQKVFLGKVELTDEQIAKMFKGDVQIRLKELKRIYGESWNKLKVNEKFTILSLFFNLPGLAGKGTNFMKHIKKYVATNNIIHLQNAVIEVEKKSNAARSAGIQNRRNAEGAMLASYKCQLYAKPNEAADSKNIDVAEINKTIVPINNASSALNKNSEYFIWRTKMDHKVRDDHLSLEGKIFKKSEPPMGYVPGTMHNCRCWAEPVPDSINIKDDEQLKMAFNLYLRKGIINPILYSPRLNLL